MGCCTFSADDFGEDYRQWEDHPNRKEWEIIQDLGQGAFSAVVLARHVVSRDIAALKLIFLDNPDVDAEMEELLIREGQLLQQFDHPNIVSCRGVLKGSHCHVIVLEVLTGGHVFDKLHGLSNLYSERDVAAVFTQIAQAVAYMHANGILHRDIKPENVLFARPPTTNAAVPTVKLIDLGMAVPYDPQKPKKGCLGTAGFIAPEIIKGEIHTPAMDVYAMGVLLFVMLVGRKPFNFTDVEKLKYAYMTLQEAPGLQDPRWLDLSPDAKDLLMGMLSCDPKRRLSMIEVMKHDWVMSKGGLVLRPLGQDVALGAATVAALRRLRNLGVGAVALPTVVKATEAAKRNRKDASIKDGSVWKQKQTAEHKAFLEAMNRMKKREASIKGGGAFHNLARTITAKSYVTLHDHSLRSKDGPASHPITRIDPSIHGGDLSVRNPSNTSSVYSVFDRSASGALTAAGMKRTGTSLLLSDLLPSDSGSLHGGDGLGHQQLPHGRNVMHKSRSAEGLVSLDDQPRGLELLRASVKQYMEVAAQNRSVRGGRAGLSSSRGPSQPASLHDGSAYAATAGMHIYTSQPLDIASTSGTNHQQQGAAFNNNLNGKGKANIEGSSNTYRASSNSAPKDDGVVVYPKGYLEQYGSSHSSGLSNVNGKLPHFPNTTNTVVDVMGLSPASPDGSLDGKERSVHGGILRGKSTTSRLPSADPSISSHNGIAELGTIRVVRRNSEDSGSYNRSGTFGSSYDSQGMSNQGGKERRKSEEMRRKVVAIKSVEGE